MNAGIAAISVPIANETKNGRQQEEDPGINASEYDSLCSPPVVLFRQVCLVRFLSKNGYCQDQGQNSDDQGEICEVSSL